MSKPNSTARAAEWRRPTIVAASTVSRSDALSNALKPRCRRASPPRSRPGRDHAGRDPRPVTSRDASPRRSTHRSRCGSAHGLAAHHGLGTSHRASPSSLWSRRRGSNASHRRRRSRRAPRRTCARRRPARSRAAASPPAVPRSTGLGIPPGPNAASYAAWCDLTREAKTGRARATPTQWCLTTRAVVGERSTLVVIGAADHRRLVIRDLIGAHGAEPRHLNSRRTSRHHSRESHNRRLHSCSSSRSVVALARGVSKGLLMAVSWRSSDGQVARRDLAVGFGGRGVRPLV